MGEVLLERKNNFNYLDRGYTSCWLAILYIVGAYFGKFILFKEINFSLKYYILWIFIFIFTSFITSFMLFKFDKTLFYNYVSPSIVLQALSLVIVFSKLNIKIKFITRIIGFVSPFTFNIIFVHMRLFFPTVPIKTWFFNIVKELNPNFIFFKIYGLAIIVFIICSIVDYLRSLLFKILRIRDFCIFTEKKITLILNKINF